MFWETRLTRNDQTIHEDRKSFNYWSGKKNQYKIQGGDEAEAGIVLLLWSSAGGGDEIRNDNRYESDGKAMDTGVR